MSAFADLQALLLSLSNKIRSKLGTENTYTPTNAIAAIDDVYDAGEAAGIAETKVGTAQPEDVLSGTTFTNATRVGANGSMTNNGAVSQSLNCGGSYTVPAGYHNGSGKVTANSLASQTGVDSGKTAVTAGTMVSGYQGWVNGSKVTGTFTGQTKTQAPSTSAIDVTPDSGKYLTKVTVSAISPQRAAGTAAVASGKDSTGPYVYFPYGWYPSGGNDRQYVRMTAAQAVAACPSQEKTVTSSRSAQTVTPDSGKLLSKVTVNALAPTGTYTASSRGASLDMGATSNYRYVNTNGVPNSNSGTYTPSGHGTALDMGATNTYRYVNTTNAYNAGVNAIKNAGTTGEFPRNGETGWYNDGTNAYGWIHIPEKYYGAFGTDWAPEVRMTKAQVEDFANQCGVGKKAPLSRVQNSCDALTMLSISFHSGDVLKHSDRYFTRTSSRPAYACVIFTDAGYYGYCLISMYSDAFSGTSSAYGELESVNSRTANGYTYYFAAMSNKYPGGINPNAMTLHISGTSTYVGLPWIPTQYKNQYWYAGVDAFVADVLCKI